MDRCGSWNILVTITLSLPSQLFQVGKGQAVFFISKPLVASDGYEDYDIDDGHKNTIYHNVDIQICNPVML